MTNLEKNRKIREKIQNDVDEFIKNGGEIKIVPAGVSGQTTKPKKKKKKNLVST